MSPFGIEKVFSFGGRKEEKEKKDGSLKPRNDFRVEQEINVESPETTEIIKTESKEPQLHGFKIGDKVLLRDFLRRDDIFKTKKAEIAGPSKSASQVQIKMDNPDSPFGPKVVYDAYPRELIKLNEHELRMAKQLGMREVKFFKNTLVQIKKMEEWIAEIKNRKTFDQAMKEKIQEFKRVGQQLKDEMLKEKFEKKRWDDIKRELWNVLDKIPDMLDNIEENYPSDDWERVKTRKGYRRK